MGSTSPKICGSRSCISGCCRSGRIRSTSSIEWGIERPARQEPSSALEREPKITALPRQAGKSVFDAMALLSDGVSKHLSVGIDEAFRQRLNKKLGAIELNATLAQRQLKGRGENWARRALYSISLLRGELAALREDIKDVSNG